MKARLQILVIFCIVPFVMMKPSEHRLSSVSHTHPDGSHDSAYDHEAFLGKEQAAEFDKLTKEESLRRLELIVDKIDTDHNGEITYEELRDWVKRVHDYSITRDTSTEFKELGGNDGVLTWEAFSRNAHLKESEVHPDDLDKHREQIERDRRKWSRVDENRDGVLSEREFVFWQHPSEHPEMRDFYVEETLSRMDANKDGVLSKEEYIMSRKSPHDEDSAEFRERMSKEVEDLEKTYDQNHNQVFEPNEIAEWIAPVDYDLVSAETHHLIHAADDDGDKKLTKAEVLTHHDLFVGSEATAQGRALEYHEEL